MSDEPRTGIPVLAGRMQDGRQFPGEPILYFDRNDDKTPRERLHYRLQQRFWKPDMIEPFLDRLGFKT